MYLCMFAAAQELEEIKSVNIKLNSPKMPTMSNGEKSKNIFFNLNTSRSSWEDRREVEKVLCGLDAPSRGARDEHKLSSQRR